MILISNIERKLKEIMVRFSHGMIKNIKVIPNKGPLGKEIEFEENVKDLGVIIN